MFPFLTYPLALAALHDLLTGLNRAVSNADRAQFKGQLVACGDMLGLLRQAPEAWLKGEGDEAVEIEGLIARRLSARAAKNFSEADRIRTELAIRGVLLEDKPNGKTEWRRAV